MHHTLESAKSWLNPESHCLVNGSFLLTESFCKNNLFSVTSLWCTFVNPFLVVHTGWRALIYITRVSNNKKWLVIMHYRVGVSW